MKEFRNVSLNKMKNSRLKIYDKFFSPLTYFWNSSFIFTTHLRHFNSVIEQGRVEIRIREEEITKIKINFPLKLFIMPLFGKSQKSPAELVKVGGVQIKYRVLIT